MLAWFTVIGVLGLVAIVHNPEVLRGLDPRYGFAFLTRNGLAGFTILGGVILAVTGVEALYADMSHFGRGPIVTGWYVLVFPALLLNYFGQGAKLVADPTALANPFYALAPGWALIPMVVLATIATVIASQALISGTFTLVEQAIALNLAPRMLVRHTSQEQKGQSVRPGRQLVARDRLRDPRRRVSFQRPPRVGVRPGGRVHDALHVAGVLRGHHQSVALESRAVAAGSRAVRRR